MFQELIDLGINPRIAIAIKRMVSAGKLPRATPEQIRVASKDASRSLCASIADTFHKVAKGGGGGGGGGGGEVVLPSGACFVEGSQVRTVTGSTPIESLLPGNKVLGFDEISGEIKTLTVEKTASKPVGKYLSFHTETTSFDVTESHPLLTRTGWVNAGSIKEGDSLLGFDAAGKKISEVLSVATIEKSANVYVMEITEDPHTYIIDGIVAHNAKISEDEKISKMAESTEEEAEEEDIRKDERKVAEWTVKYAYALAKNLGADEVTALTASMYAFTQIPPAHEVRSEILTAEWWNGC